MALTHISWIPATDVGLNWQAEWHAPVFLELERELARSGDNVRELGALVEVVPLRPPESASTAPWVVKNGGDWIVESASIGQSNKALIPLPSSCVIVDRIFREGLKALYWSSEVFEGEGCTMFNTVMVLRPQQEHPIAWLQDELQRPYVALQAARRASTLSGIRRISSTRDLLEIRIRVPPLKERDARSRVVARGLRSLRNQVVHGAPAAGGESVRLLSRARPSKNDSLSLRLTFSTKASSAHVMVTSSRPRPMTTARISFWCARSGTTSANFPQTLRRRSNRRTTRKPCSSHDHCGGSRANVRQHPLKTAMIGRLAMRIACCHSWA